MRPRALVLAFLVSFVPALAWADVSGTIALPAGTAFSLDTGATVSTGGDIFWSGTALAPQGSAKLLNLGNAQADAATAFAAISQSELAALTYTTTPIPASELTADDIFAVATNGGNYAKLLVTAVSGTTITVEYVTYGVTGSVSGLPTVSAVVNNYSGILPGLPNYGIAPGSLFIVGGLNLSNVTTPLQSSGQTGGLVTLLDGVSVSVTVGSTTKLCYLYYLSPTQIDAVLPGSTPLGTGTITVTNNSQASAPVSITVVQSAFGMITYNGTQVAAYNASNNLLTTTNAANPNQTIVLWGSGVGDDPNDDNHTYPQQQNNLAAPPYSIPMTVYVGGLPASIAYAGPSLYPGVDQIDIVVPPGVAAGCFVSVEVVSGSIVSNVGTIPIATTGSACPESPLQLLLQSLSGNASAKLAFLQVSQKITSSSTTNSALAQFLDVQGLGGYVSGGAVSDESCIEVSQAGTGTIAYTTTGLNAGTAVTVTGPNNSVTLTPLVGITGIYAPSTAVPANFITAAGGTYTFANGAGGPDVKAFSTSFNFPTPIAWTNMSSFTTVNRTQPLTVAWTGGSTTSQVLITGSSSVESYSQNLTVTFTCLANTTDGQFTVPSEILLALPPGPGTLDVGTTGAATPFTVLGSLDAGLKYGSSTSEQAVTYQ